MAPNGLANLICPPELTDNFEQYKKEIEVWQLLKNYSATEEGPVLFRSLTGKAKEAALQLTVNQIGSDTGVKQILGKVGELYRSEKNHRICSVLEKFETFKRSPSMTMSHFVIDFENLHNKLKDFEVTYPDGVLAFRMMKAASMSSEHEKLLRATVKTGEWSYAAVKEQLGKIFNDEVAIKLQSNHPPPEKAIKLENIEDTFLARSIDPEFSHSNYDEFDSLHYENYTAAHEDYESSYPQDSYMTAPNEEHDIYYGPSRTTPNWKWNARNFHGRGNPGPWRTRSSFNPQNYPPQNFQNQRGYQRYSNEQPNQQGKYSMNPKDYRKCRSTYHYWEQCPHVSPQEKMNATPKKVMYNDNTTKEELYIALYQKSSPTTADEIICLMGETLDKAVVDSGCTKSCAGQRWYDAYRDSLTEEELKQIQSQESGSVFRFGDSPPVAASEKVLLQECFIGNRNSVI